MKGDDLMTKKVRVTVRVIRNVTVTVRPPKR